jgi:hypothetical protein
MSSPARKSDLSIRFAVGSPEDPYSAIWNVVANRNDVYLFARQMARWLKTSLHASGVWRLAWTKESQLLTTGTDDRVIIRWHRLPEFRPGWTQGVSVLVPWTPIGRHFPATDIPAGKPVEWVRTPAPWDKVVFTILFSAPGVPQSSWESIRDPGDRNLGRLVLPNGEGVWVAVRRGPLEPRERAEAGKLAGELRINLAPGASPQNIRGGSAMVFFGPPENRSPIIMNACFGPGNIFGAPSQD